jgi:hypothetical protein
LFVTVGGDAPVNLQPLGAHDVRSDLRAFLLAVGVFVTLMVAYFALATVLREVPEPLGTLVLAAWWAAPLVSGFLCGYLVRRRQVLVLLTLGVVGAACLGGINLAAGALGISTDLGGLANLPWVVGLSLLTIIPLVVIGGAIGAKLRNASHA